MKEFDLLTMKENRNHELENPNQLVAEYLIVQNDFIYVFGIGRDLYGHMEK